jgi:peptide/nickel transport system substrate-binding protein
METRRVIRSAAFGSAALFALAACTGGGGGLTSPAGFNAAVTKVVNPPNHKGGTLRFGMWGTPDSTDPGNTFITWDFTRLYAMPLMTYKSCPGA